MVICLERGADLHMFQLMPLPLSLASVKSRLFLPFWNRLTWVVPEKGPLNGCVCVYCSITSATKCTDIGHDIIVNTASISVLQYFQYAWY